MNGSGERGIAIAQESVLPFLLAARSQVIVAQTRAGAQRATFAEGLASSYEAFLHTRSSNSGHLGGDSLVDEENVVVSDTSDRRLARYLNELERALPEESAYATHPKVAALVSAVDELWREGEKVVVFCHYRETGRAVEKHLSSALHARLMSEVAARVGGEEEADRRLEAVGKLFDAGDSAHRRLQEFTYGLLEPYADLADDQRDLVARVVNRFVRNRVFLARYWDFDAASHAQALDNALSKQDASGSTLEQRLGEFARFIAERCEQGERKEYLEALDKLQTARAFEEAEELGPLRRVKRMPNIALVNGGVQQETRRRRMLGFNTPFFPEILVASNVLAEGVDLHLNCRYIIHHDLCWNPSTLEQRTGRVDRIHAKAERVKQPIHVYLPYIAGTQDEKMYRVVRDRQRWFQVVMGEEYAQDESSTDKLEDRVPLPESAAKELAFRLEVK